MQPDPMAAWNQHRASVWLLGAFLVVLGCLGAAVTIWGFTPAPSIVLTRNATLAMIVEARTGVSLLVWCVLGAIALLALLAAVGSRLSSEALSRAAGAIGVLGMVGMSVWFYFRPEALEVRASWLTRRLLAEGRVAGSLLDDTRHGRGGQCGHVWTVRCGVTAADRRLCGTGHVLRLHLWVLGRLTDGLRGTAAGRVG